MTLWAKRRDGAARVRERRICLIKCLRHWFERIGKSRGSDCEFMRIEKSRDCLPEAWSFIFALSCFSLDVLKADFRRAEIRIDFKFCIRSRSMPGPHNQRYSFFVVNVSVISIIQIDAMQSAKKRGTFQEGAFVGHWTDNLWETSQKEPVAYQEPLSQTCQSQ
jgi:hypothetical protein